jgi:hypothetical protein
MTDNINAISEEEKAQKIQSLREMITAAEQTIQGAKAMLLQIEGKKKVGRHKKVVEETDSNIVQGTFDGQIMIGTNGKQYPVPANYASKSKLVEGDFLKLTIVQDGTFIYKQIGPVPRQNKIGVVGQDSSGNYFVAADGKPYKILLASITYFNAEPGDEVAIVTSQEPTAQWASIEAVLQHTGNSNVAPAINALPQQFPQPADTKPKTATEILTGSTESTLDSGSDIVDEWTPDIDEIEKEIRAEMNQSQ